jgi:hypothetical protein
VGNCRFLLVNAADVGPTGSAMEESGEGGELGRRTDGVDLDAPIVEVAGIPREAEFRGGALGKVAIADALDAAADKPAPCFTPGIGRRGVHAGQVIVYRGWY